MNLPDSAIDVGFRRLRGSSWTTILSRIAVYGVRPYEAFTGYVSCSMSFVCDEVDGKPGRVIPPLFYKESWLDCVDGPLPSVTAAQNRDYSVRLTQVFGRRDVPFTSSQLRDRWFSKLGDTHSPEEIAKLRGVTLATYARSSHDYPKPSSHGYVYVIRHLSSGLHKIGITKRECLDTRMKSLGVGECSELVHLAYASNYKDVERTIHKKYSHLRLPQTEYFTLSPQHVNEVKAYAPS